MLASGKAHANPSEQQPQCKLHQTGIVVLAADDAKLRRAECESRRVEPHAVKKIENLRPELQLDVFPPHWRVLEDCEVPIIDTGGSHIRQIARQAPEGKGWRCGESRSVKPAAQPGLRRAVQLRAPSHAEIGRASCRERV